jgi:hypothetical protein
MSELKLRQKNDNNEEVKARNLIKPGMELYGYLGGLFGRESFGTKRVSSVYDDHIIAVEDGFTLVSKTIDGKIYSWKRTIEDSNMELSLMEGQDSYEDTLD